MAPNSLSPASVVIDYHTPFASHRMTIPTKEWFPTSITGTIGSYEAWGGGTVDAFAMVTNLCTALADIVWTSTVFDAVTVYTQATPTSDNIPRASALLGIPGTVTPGTDKSQAQSVTFNCKTLANGDFKLVLLDQAFGADGFVATHPLDFSADVVALETQLKSNANAWSGRDDAQISQMRKITYDLNDRLQKLYKMSA